MRNLFFYFSILSVSFWFGCETKKKSVHIQENVKQVSFIKNWIATGHSEMPFFVCFTQWYAPNKTKLFIKQNSVERVATFSANSVIFFFIFIFIHFPYGLLCSHSKLYYMYTKINIHCSSMVAFEWYIVANCDERFNRITIIEYRVVDVTAMEPHHDFSIELIVSIADAYQRKSIRQRTELIVSRWPTKHITYAGASTSSKLASDA